jgi:hypothetical protein
MSPKIVLRYVLYSIVEHPVALKLIIMQSHSTQLLRVYGISATHFDLTVGHLQALQIV